MKKVCRVVSLALCLAVLTGLLGGCGDASVPSAESTEIFTTAASTQTVTQATKLTTTNRQTTTMATQTAATKKPTSSATTLTTKTTKQTVQTQPSRQPQKPTSDRYESLAQQAVIETALAYLARGSRIQYADTRLAPGDFVPSAVRYRWEKGVNSPEDATAQRYTYTNCAAFTYDVYYHALNYDILSYTTASLIEKGQPEMVYKYYPTGSESSAEKAAIEAEFRQNLKMGDIIVVRYNGASKGNGHAMLYVGKDVLKSVEAEKNNAPEGDFSGGGYYGGDGYTYDIIHSSGSNYNYSQFTERFERNGSISLTSVDMLFDRSSSRYVFSRLISVGIVRPLNTFDGEVPQETVDRINNMHGIVAEKLSSHTIGMTVNPGDEMTFTFTLENQSGQTKRVKVRDVVPTNTTYVSGASAVSGRTLSWDVTLPARGKISVSYTVKVNANTPYGEYIVSDGGSVGGVSVDCPSVMVAKTLSAEQQEALKTAVAKFTDTELEGTALLNAIYKEAFGTEVTPDSMDGLLTNVFMPYLGLLDYFTPNSEGIYAQMMVPTMYGGRATVPDFGIVEEHVRTRLPYAHQVMVGDVLVAAETGDNSLPRLYLLMGDTAYDLLNGMRAENCDMRLETTLGHNRFIILRPSMRMK